MQVGAAPLAANRRIDLRFAPELTSGLRIAALRRHSAVLELGCEIVGLCGKDLLHQRLKIGVAIGRSLAFSFFRERVSARKLCGLMSVALRKSATACAELPRWLSRIPSRL